MAKVPRSRKGAETTHGEGVTVPAFRPFAALEPGRDLDLGGELEFRGVIREGQWSCVLKALHRPSGTLRAVKVVRPELVEAEEQQRAYRAEAERAAALSGGVIVRLLGVGVLDAATAERTRWWATSAEWVEGKSLRELLAPVREPRTLSLGGLAERAAAEAPPPAPGLMAEQAFAFAEKAAAGVAELHRAGLTHLDLRPEHLLSTRRGSLRVIGHGLPVELRRRGDEVLGIAWRSSPYAPSELALGEWDRLGPAADVYQLAVVTYELFAGVPCSPWVGYEELCETTDFLSPDLDELIHDCLGPPDRRPADAVVFLGRLRAAARGFEDNRHHERRRPERKAREIWARARALAGRDDAPWAYVVGLCSRLIEEKPHLLPFGKIPAAEVRALLESAQGRLKQARRAHLDALVKARAWSAAGALVERWRGDVPASEADALRIMVDLAQLAEEQRDSRSQAAAYHRVVEVLKEPQIDPAQREQASEALEELMQAPPPAPVPLPVPVVTDLGALPPHERWRVEVDGETTLWRVVVGPALRLGRGSWDEFGNHVDLRPTRREAAESSITLALAQRISRAGHLELRVAPESLEAFCLGTHGAVVDGRLLRRGERAALADEGAFNLAEGAAAGTYRQWRGGDGVVTAVSLTMTGGVGTGRRVAWVLGTLPLEMLDETGAGGALAIPTPAGWFVESGGPGVRLGARALAAGERVEWPESAALRLSQGCRVVRA
ncbi:MAG TPA: protein kinase [Thermoanaerobaculaceae bacterium]|nr:protein kinase [Thermoanaerobaculaceae bacterium]